MARGSTQSWYTNSPDDDHPYDSDCEDQGMMPTDTCVKHGCKNSILVNRGGYWCCPCCGSSYGHACRRIARNRWI